MYEFGQKKKLTILIYYKLHKLYKIKIDFCLLNFNTL